MLIPNHVEACLDQLMRAGDQTVHPLTLARYRSIFRYHLMYPEDGDAKVHQAIDENLMLN
jgi:hypothetical protein